MDKLFQSKTLIIARKEVAESTIEVSFKRPAGFEFIAGQYCQIVIPQLLFTDPKGNSRVFSIASSPNDKERVVIAFRNSSSGFKRTLIESPEGQEIIIKGPFGRDFKLPEDLSSRAVFIAGGIGITPFLSMSRFATEEKLALPITLIYANRDEKSMAYKKEFEDMASNNPNFTIKNKFGLLNEQFIRENVKDAPLAQWYTAGPPPMVGAALNILSLLKVEPSRIHTEKFTGY